MSKNDKIHAPAEQQPLSWLRMLPDLSLQVTPGLLATESNHKPTALQHLHTVDDRPAASAAPALAVAMDTVSCHRTEQQGSVS